MCRADQPNKPHHSPVPERNVPEQHARRVRGRLHAVPRRLRVRPRQPRARAVRARLLLRAGHRPGRVPGGHLQLAGAFVGWRSGNSSRAIDRLVRGSTREFGARRRIIALQATNAHPRFATPLADRASRRRAGRARRVVWGVLLCDVVSFGFGFVSSAATTRSSSLGRSSRATSRRTACRARRATTAT